MKLSIPISGTTPGSRDKQLAVLKAVTVRSDSAKQVSLLKLKS